MNPQIGFLLNQSLESLRNSNLESAELYLKQVIRLQSTNPHALRLLGVIAAQRKQYPEALNYLNSALKSLPKDALTLSNLGNVYLELKDYNKALDAYDKSIKVEPNYEEAWSNKGNALFELKRFEEALVHHEKAISLRPDYAQAYSNKGNTLNELKRFEEALVHHEKAISLRPDYAQAYRNAGITLYELKRFEEAITHYEQAISLKPDYHEAWSNIGLAMQKLQRSNEALPYYDQALSIKPNYHEGWVNKGVALHELKRFEEAIAHYDQALSLKPDYYEAWSNKGITLHELKRFEEAIAHYDQALSLQPDNHATWTNKGETFNVLKRHFESAKCYLKALTLKDEDSYLLGEANHQMMLICDWTNYENNIAKLFELTDEGRMGNEPFGFQAIASSEKLLKKCAEVYSNDKFPMLGNLANNAKYQHNKIRIGYLCGEFRSQATSMLMTHVWELHDKSKFEIFAFDNGWDDGSDYRQRIEEAFYKIFDISRLTDKDAAKLIKSNEIDILINLNGFFGLARQGIFSYRPSPVQVNYLGFPGTIGAKYIDYIVADKVVIPDESKIYYVEKVVQLPNSYQANDNQKIISKRRFTKTELGLPEKGFVFTCFNNNYKITPSTFDSWMRILTHVQGSVLWLLADNPEAKKNLIQAAIVQGIDSSRLVFAERISIPEHLARHDLADLFLDTLPYNAHTTCSDALWAGLPVLTLKGNTFPGRVSASLLSAVGLNELIASSPEEYEAIAIQLAEDPNKLSVIKQKLKKDKKLTPLFNTDQFTRHLETAYIQMHERYQAGLNPAHMTID